MPQMWRHALPGLGNQWLVLLKDTALVSLISVNDLMLQTKSIATRTQEPFTWYIVAAAIYLVITLISQYILKRIDLRATRFERRPPCRASSAGKLRFVPAKDECCYPGERSLPHLPDAGEFQGC